MTPTQVDFENELAEFAPERMSAYFLELEGLLIRIDSATTYYQVLGMDRGVGHEGIKASFHQLLDLLFPPYVVGRVLPSDFAARVERAFHKASQAFSVLASFARRKEYDNALLWTASKPVPPAAPIGSRISQQKIAGSGGADSGAAAADSDHVALGQTPQRGQVYRESVRARLSDNRRRCERFKLAIPVRVTGHDRRNGRWREMAETIAVSRTGVRLRLRRRVKHGTVLYLTLPLPAKLRAHGFTEQSYNVYALVRRVEPPKQGARAVGLEFIGERPPAGYLDRPWSVFRPKRWSGNDRRRPDREEQAENVSIEYFDEGMQSIKKEEARTENISRYGLRISGTTAPAEFDLLLVTCPRLKFEGMAALRNRYTGQDGLERICVLLVDKEWPLRG